MAYPNGADRTQAATEEAGDCQTKAAKRSRGRPKGSKNKNQRQVVLNAEMTQVKAMLTRLLILLGDTMKQAVRTRLYQFTAVHKKFADKLNVVIIHKANTDTGKSSHVILFSTNHELGWEALVDYYRLRFQIEFNFRDAKQHWGLDE